MHRGQQPTFSTNNCISPSGRGTFIHIFCVSLLLAVGRLDPFGVPSTGETGFVWIYETLNSGYSEEEWYSMAWAVAQPLGRHSFVMQYALVPPLLYPRISLPCLNICTIGPSPQSGLISLLIPSDGPRDADSSPALPNPTSMLSPNHPL